MEDQISPLVLTKLRVPVLRSRLLLRSQILDLLDSKEYSGLILVCAPAGYGKTTVLAEWAQALKNNDTAVAWYSLDSGDDEPIPFGTYLVNSLVQALGPISELTHITQLLRSSPEMDLQRILPSVINTVVLSGTKCVLILDDYHLITSPAIHTTLAYLLEHLPENLRIAIGSRSDPPLPLARLRVRGELLEVRAANLCFTTSETEQFLNGLMDLKLSSEGVNVLSERTEGWIAGLQLAALSLSNREDKEWVIASFSGSHRYLVEYLLDEVVNQQPEEVQSFLLATSILERLCAPLCDALLEQQSDQLSPSEYILHQLEQANLFVVSLDDQGTWYRYHHLFRDFLQARLKNTRPEQISTIYRAACEWLADHELLREAARHAFLTQDWEYAAAFVEKYSFSMIVHGDLSIIYEWCSALPEEVMQNHPMLCLLQSMALAYGFRKKNRERIEARLRQVDAVIDILEDRDAAQGLYDMAAVVRTFLAMAPDPAVDPHDLLALSARMLSAYPEGNTGRFSGLLLTGYAYLALNNSEAAYQVLETARQLARQDKLYFGIVETTFHLAQLAYCQGKHQIALEICSEAQADIQAVLNNPEQELPGLGSLDIWQGYVLLEQNHLQEAETCLKHGLDLMGGGMHPYYLLTAYTALYRLCEIQGRSREAIGYLERLEAAWPDIGFCTRGLRIKSSLRTQHDDPEALDEAKEWCREFTTGVVDILPVPGIGPFGAAEAYYMAYLTWMHLQNAIGNGGAVVPYITRQIEAASSNKLTRRVIELSLLEAQVFRAEGQDELVWTALERALSLSQPAGYVRIFDQGPALTRLLVEAAQQGLHKEYIEHILNLIGEPEGAGQEHEVSTRSFIKTPFGETISERELQVLRLIAQGATNQEIADQLVITVGTVKSHINHILNKLGAHNRTDALRQAREAGYEVF